MADYLFRSMMTMKCPSCHRQAIFKYPNPYNLKHMGKMHERCPVCGQNFRMEPGFYFGGAYISYALAVLANLVMLYVLSLFRGNLFNHGTEVIITIILTTLLVSPIVFRYSRVMLLYIFVRYKGADKK
jgi:hypothetical protein